MAANNKPIEQAGSAMPSINQISNQLNTTHSETANLLEVPDSSDPITTEEEASTETKPIIKGVSTIPSPRLTKLTTYDGADVYLVGTSHFSRDSIEDVQVVMRSIRPTAVVVELCHARLATMMMTDEMDLRNGCNVNLATFRKLVANNGLAQALFHTLCLKISASLIEKFDIAPGGEFRAAFKEAKNLPSCQVFLGDRDLSITISRTVNSLSFKEKLLFLYQAVKTDEIADDLVEKLKDKDLLTELLLELGGQFQALKRVVLDERDIILAHVIHSVARQFQTSSGPRSIVAVVGIGHVAGIIDYWGRTTDEEVQSLYEVPKASKTKIVFCKLIKYGTIGLICFGVYKVGSSAVHYTPKLIDRILKFK